MVQVSYPGVYIVERSSGVRTITGVATSIAAFVGYTRMGPPDSAVTITSFADFERIFGGLDRESPVSYQVRQFFSNGGTQAIIVRVALGAASAAWTVSDDGGTAVFSVEAASPGAWGNELRLSVQRTNVRNPDSDFNLTVSRFNPNGDPILLETHRNLSVDHRSSRYAAAAVNAASSRVQLEPAAAALAFAAPGYALSREITTVPTGNVPRSTIGLVVDGRPYVATVGPTTAPLADHNALVTLINDAITATSDLATMLEVERADVDGAVDPAGRFVVLRSLATGDRVVSSSVVVERGQAGSLAQLIGLGLANGGREVTGAAEHRPAIVTDVAPTTLGIDGTPGGAAQIIGSASAKTGMYALLDVDLFNILVIPETFDLTTDGTETGLIAEAASLCELKRAFYIVDPPSDRTFDDIDNWVTGNLTLGLTARNVAVYFPPVRITDPLGEMRPRTMPASGTIAGIYARTDAQRGVWKAPAGTDATLNGTLDVARPMNDRENGIINPLGINALRSFPAYGRVVWGARTGRGADAQADEYKYIPIRRLALFLEESLYRGTQWVVFEPNDEPLWAQIRLNIGVFMNGLFRQGAFQGRTQSEAFFVKCDAETTTQADRNLGIVNIIVGFAPLKPAEFVVLTIQQIAGDLQ